MYTVRVPYVTRVVSNRDRVLNENERHGDDGEIGEPSCEGGDGGASPATAVANAASASPANAARAAARTAMTDGASGSAATAAATAATAFEAPVEGSIGGSVRRAECRTTGDASGAAFEGSGEGIPDA